MYSEELSELLTIPEKKESLLGFTSDLDLDIEYNIQNMDQDYVVPAVQEPKWAQNVNRQEDNDDANEIDELDFDDLESGEDESTTLSKRQDPGAPRKKRLKGQDLISSLKRNPMFRDHEELFQENMDDLSRKKMMQKIRNRISAQESRDRKKAQFCDLADKNFVLEKENASLKAEVDSLRKENKELRRKVEELSKPSSKSNSTKPESESNTEQSVCGASEVDGLYNEDEESSVLGRLLRRKESGDSRLGWKPFLLIVVAVALCVLHNPYSPDLDTSVVKSSAIVPLISSKAMTTPNHRALVKLEQVCDKFCNQKCDRECQRDDRRHKAVRDELLSLGSEVFSPMNQVVLGGNDSSLDIVINSEPKTGGVVLQKAQPYSTLVCSAVVEMDKQPSTQDDEWIHFVYPKKKDALIGGELSDQYSEYEGLLAKVVSRKDIRVFEGNPITPQAI